MMAALGLDVGASLSAEERFRQVAAVMKRRDAQDRREQKELRRQQKLDKKVTFPCAMSHVPCAVSYLMSYVLHVTCTLYLAMLACALDLAMLACTCRLS